VLALHVIRVCTFIRVFLLFSAEQTKPTKPKRLNSRWCYSLGVNEKIIRALVPIIPVIFLIGCVGAAFATHNWDIQATLFGENPLQAVERFLPDEMSTGAEPFEVTNVTLEGRNKVVVGMIIHSPLTVPVKIKELTAEFSLDGSPIRMSLPEEVTIPAQGSASVILEGLLPEAQRPPEAELTKAFVLESMELILDAGGVELKLGNLGPGV
jgi:hypothetical protein